MDWLRRFLLHLELKDLPPPPPPTAELVSEKFRKVYSGRLERIASRNSSASWECFRTEIK